MGETRDNKYDRVRLPVVFTTGETPGVDLLQCKECGALVEGHNNKVHNKWHREQEASWK